MDFLKGYAMWCIVSFVFVLSLFRVQEIEIRVRAEVTRR